MENKDLKILFFGTPDFAVPVLAKLKSSGYNLIGLVTQPDRPAGRKKILTPPPAKVAAQKLGLPVYQWAKLDGETIKKIKELNPDLIIVVAYGKLLPPELLDMPKYKCLNVHPSLLPKYRGPSPIQTAILNGDTSTGVSIIQLDAKLDHGPTVSQKKFEILKDDSCQTLGNTLACEGAQMLVEIIPDYIAGKISPQAQDHVLATETKILDKADGEIDWKKSSVEIDRRIRACYPWPGAWTEETGKRIKILKAHLENDELYLDWVQPEGKEPMRYNDFLNGNVPLY